MYQGMSEPGNIEARIYIITAYIGLCPTKMKEKNLGRFADVINITEDDRLVLLNLSVFSWPVTDSTCLSCPYNTRSIYLYLLYCVKSNKSNCGSGDALAVHTVETMLATRATESCP